MAETIKSEDADLRLILALIWRGKWAALAFALLAAGGALAVLRATPTVYDATAQVLLDARDMRTTGFEQVVGDLPIDNAIVASEIAVLKSRRLLGEVVDGLGLASDPEFGASASGALSRARALVVDWAPMAADWWPEAPPAAESARARAIQRLDRAVTASQSGRSYVIAVTARTTSPDKSAVIANALATRYIDDQVATKIGANEAATDWLATRMNDLKRDAVAAEKAVERYRAEMGVGEGRSQAVAAQQLGEVNSQLVAARAARAESEARYNQIRRMISEQGEGAAANVLSSPLILSLRQQRAEVRRREAELATRYGPKHPKMINVRAELSDIANAVAAELRKRVAGLQNDVEVAVAREAALTDALGDLEAQSTAFGRAEVGLRQLERVAEAKSRIFESVLARQKEADEERRLQEADARVISRAAPALEPSGPRRGLIGGLAGLAGAMLGFGLIFLGEFTTNTYRTGAETQRLLGVPVLAKLPRNRAIRRRAKLVEELETRPNSAYAEAARALRNGVTLGASGDPPKVIMATSAAPGEGKSSTCVALAHLSGQMGRRAVVVECDFRRPSLAKTVGGARPMDLNSVLRGDAALDDALVPIGRSGAHALPVARPAPQAADALAGDRFKALVEDLSRRFDLILLDTPPALAVSDALAAARLADATLFLIRWDHTPRQAVAECMAKLEEVGAAPLGVALTLVDRRREAAYEYGGFRKGAPDYGPYYA